MSTNKSTWWSVTAFGDEIELMKGPKFPEWVKAVYGGEEECPETKRRHFQGAVQCYTQVRLSKFKSWLATAHLEPAKQEHALKKYVMKAETAIGEKSVRENMVPHMSAQDICMLLARQTDNQTVESLDVDFYSRVRMILAVQPELAGQLMNPSLRNFYEKTAIVWQQHVLRELDELVDKPVTSIVLQEVSPSPLRISSNNYPGRAYDD